MATGAAVEAYQIHVWIRQISPMISRRLLVGCDSSLADLHHTLQIAFGWSDSHLHRFHIHGRDYGIGKIGGLAFSTDAKRVRLADLRFRINERFLYEYDLGDAWQHEVRIEQRKFSARMRPRAARDLVCGALSLVALDSIVKR